MTRPETLPQAEPETRPAPLAETAPAGTLVWLRSALFNLCFFSLTGLIAVAALPMLLAPRSALMLLLRRWAWLVVWLLRVICGIRFRLTGAEHLPPAGAPALIAAKHQSAFDTIIWLGLLPDAAYVLKRELLRIPAYGWLALHAGMIAVDRAAAGSAMRHLVRAGRAAAALATMARWMPPPSPCAPPSPATWRPSSA